MRNEIEPDFYDDDQDGLETYLTDLLEDPQFSASYDDTYVRNKLRTDLTSLRKAEAITQTVVSQAMGTSQSVVSEFESSAADVLLSTFQRYARAVGARVTVKLEMPADCDFAPHVIRSRALRQIGEVHVGEPQFTELYAAWSKTASNFAHSFPSVLEELGGHSQEEQLVES